MLFVFPMTLLAVVLEHCASGHLFRSFAVAARLLGGLLDVLVHALLLGSDAAQAFFPGICFSLAETFPVTLSC